MVSSCASSSAQYPASPDRAHDRQLQHGLQEHEGSEGLARRPARLAVPDDHTRTEDGQSLTQLLRPIAQHGLRQPLARLIRIGEVRVDLLADLSSAFVVKAVEK